MIKQSCKKNLTKMNVGGIPPSTPAQDAAISMHQLPPSPTTFIIIIEFILTSTHALTIYQLLLLNCENGGNRHWISCNLYPVYNIRMSWFLTFLMHLHPSATLLPQVSFEGFMHTFFHQNWGVPAGMKLTFNPAV